MVGALQHMQRPAQASTTMPEITKERICFVPHPKTLTMAGDYEYFAAEGRHPLPYALGELVDNSLRATRRNGSRSREITISLVSSGSGGNGLVSVHDNGLGMSKRELNDWAIMNLSMKDRGLQPLEPSPAERGTQLPGAGRFLSGDLSYFGVGSKNAAFFMGGAIKITTRTAASKGVWELCIAANVLEQKHREGKAVYEEDLVNRGIGDHRTLTDFEQPFPSAVAWVQQEAEQNPQPADHDAPAASFTRVTVGALKPEILQQIADADRGGQVCRELTHMYHYYLHGEAGNCKRSGSQGGARLPGGEPLPRITVQYIRSGVMVWERDLAQVEDDMETKLLRAQKAELSFALDVPGKGMVSGVIYYFPFENDHETLPVDDQSWSQRPVTTFNMTQYEAPGGTQAVRMTQNPAATQGAPRGTQHGLAAYDDDSDEEQQDEVWGYGGTPLFEAFWQGRLIPGARVESLPFVETVRLKRSAAARDALPDAVFGRLRGALFFGPSFRVTRNKLTFRDNLQQLLAAAVPTDRHQEKKFRDWLQQCHATLDKTVRFEELAAAPAQAAARLALGEDTTIFLKIANGAEGVAAGQLVRLAKKPALVGRVLHFSISQVVREAGCYANGRVTVQPLPPEIYGEASQKTLALRRLEAVLGPKEAEEHLAGELRKVPASLQLEPMKLATGNPVELGLGEAIPDTAVAALSGSGNSLTRALLAGQKQSLTVTQRLWRLHGEAADRALAGEPSGQSLQPQTTTPATDPKHAKRGRKRKGRKGKTGSDHAEHDNNAAGNTSVAPLRPDEGELLWEVENKSPVGDTFRFARISDGLRQAGVYQLEHQLSPPLSARPPLLVISTLLVKPGPPVGFDIQGEGRAMLAVKDLMLGEQLPPLALILRDACGNAVHVPVSEVPEVLLSVAWLAAGANQEHGLILNVTQVAEEGGIKLCELQVLGQAGFSEGLPVFNAAHASVSSEQLAQRCSAPDGITAAEVQLQVAVAGLTPQSLAIRVRPGAPHALRLLPGHPWTPQDEEELQLTQVPREGAATVARLPGGAELPAFQLRAIDAWGNPTAPADGLAAAVKVECGALAPPSATFPFGADGLTMITGLRGGSAGVGVVPLTMTPQCEASSLLLQAAIAAAQPPQDLTCGIVVEPSTAPASIVILHHGQELPMEEVADADGPMAVLHGVAAGSRISGLACRCLDEAGRPATSGTAGKLQCSWAKRKSQKVALGEEPSPLPELALAEEEGLRMVHAHLAFIGQGPGASSVEVELAVFPAAGPPVRWGVSVCEPQSQAGNSLGVIPCGTSFDLEVEALDALGNRCPGGPDSSLPRPVIIPESASGLPLEYNCDEWEQAWTCRGNEQVWKVTMRLGGRAGPIRLIVTDKAGRGGAPLLTPDEVDLELQPGPAAQLAVEGPACVSAGTRAVLGEVRLRLTDACGNPVTGTSCEVILQPSALAVGSEGRAASVAAPGGNRVKLKAGAAVFKEVRVSAEEAGTYTLRIASGSRKVALEEACLILQLAPSNTVTELALDVASLPEPGTTVGGSLCFAAMLLTENGEVLPVEAAEQGLTLKLTPPGGGRADALVLAPQLPAGCAAGSLVYHFISEHLTVAGKYAAAAEYTEARPSLTKALTKKELSLRSSAASFTLATGPPVELTLEAPTCPDPHTATNGADPAQRSLLNGAAFQLRDAHGNAAEVAGVAVRLSLQWPDGGAGPRGSELPTLEGDQRHQAHATDSRGRLFLEDVRIAEGSGKVSSTSDEVTAALGCILLLEAQGLPSPSGRRKGSSSGWAPAWQCGVLFSDDAARFAMVQALSVRQAELTSRQQALEAAVAEAAQAATTAQKRHNKAAKSAEALQKQLHGSCPDNAAAAAARLAAVRRQETLPAVAEVAARPGRFGPPNSPIGTSIEACLSSGDAGVVGVFAQLATVEDERLAAVVSAAVRGLLPVLVVADNPARQRLTAHLQQLKLPLPDMLPLTNAQAYRGSTRGVAPGWEAAGQLAHELQAAACASCDPALPLPLPHSRSLMGSRKAPPPGGLSASEWPQGCLGYGLNLVRPAVAGHRGALLYPLLSVLLFTTLATATKYREYCTQGLGISAGEIVTLDGRRLSSKGIVAGDSFKVPPLDKMPACFGSSGTSLEADGVTDAAQEAVLEELIVVLEAREDAKKQLQCTQQAAEDAEANCGAELAQLEEQLTELEAQIAAHSANPTAPRKGRKKGSKQRHHTGTTQRLPTEQPTRQPSSPANVLSELLEQEEGISPDSAERGGAGARGGRLPSAKRSRKSDMARRPSVEEIELRRVDGHAAKRGRLAKMQT